MGPLEAVWHVSNLFLPALMLGMIAAAMSKFVWLRELSGVTWSRLAGPACAVNASVVLGALVLLGGDGRMLMYGAMVLACTLTLWWQGFGPGRRSRRG